MIDLASCEVISAVSCCVARYDASSVRCSSFVQLHSDAHIDLSDDSSSSVRSESLKSALNVV